MFLVEFKRIISVVWVISGMIYMTGCSLYNKAYTGLYKKYIINFSRYVEPVKSGLTNNELLPDNIRWKLVWSDEFDYSGFPDPEKWKYDDGGFGWWKSGLADYAGSPKENARVENGRLVIEARKDFFSKPTSCRLLTKTAWKYGRIDIKAKLPSGRGIWSGIWMFPRDSFYGEWPSSGEIDVVENAGFYSNACHFSVHTLYYESGDSSFTEIASASSESHVYSLIWEPEKITILVDGNEYFSYNKKENSNFSKWPFDREFYLVFNIAAGGDWGGVFGVDDFALPQKMEIDYIRVYEEQISNREEKI